MKSKPTTPAKPVKAPKADKPAPRRVPQRDGLAKFAKSIKVLG